MQIAVCVRDSQHNKENIMPSVASSNSTTQVAQPQQPTIEVISGDKKEQVRLPKDPKAGEVMFIEGDKTSYKSVPKNNLGLQTY